MSIRSRQGRRLPRPRQGDRPATGTGRVRWVCTNDLCGVAGSRGAIWHWPRRCPDCGCTRLEPGLNDASAHRAKRLELDARLADRTLSAGERKRLAAESLAWHYVDAARRKDFGAADEVRRRLHSVLAELTATERYYVAGYPRFEVLVAAFAAGDFDGAADEILQWYSTQYAADRTAENVRRVNSRMLVHWMLEFLFDERSRDHELAAEVRLALDLYYSRIHGTLSADLVQEYQTYRRLFG